MDKLQFPAEHFELVMTSMALYATPPDVRRTAIAETARVLKPNGCFLLVDWSKPKFGLWGIVWYLMVWWDEMNRDNWNNAYRQTCKAQGFSLEEDAYISSIAHRQVFRKKANL